MRLWRIDTPAQTMVLGSDGGMACCHYWGAPLPGDTDLDALFARAGVLVITAFISPYREDRDRARAVAPELFHEVYVKADLAVCETRDPKGLYKKARKGEIAEFTGISAPYEAPSAAELEVDTGTLSLGESVERLLAYVEANFGIAGRE